MGVRLSGVPFLTEEEQFSKDMAERLRSLSERVDRIALQRDLALIGYRVEQERRLQVEAELREERRGS